MKRRQFLKTVTALAAVPVIPELMCTTPPSKESQGDYAAELVKYDDVMDTITYREISYKEFYKV